MFYQVVSVIIGNDLCDFYDLYTSLSVTFVMYFNGRNKDIYFIFLASFSCSCLLCSKKVLCNGLCRNKPHQNGSEMASKAKKEYRNDASYKVLIRCVSIERCSEYNQYSLHMQRRVN